MTCYQGGLRARAAAQGWVAVAVCLLSVVAGLSTPFPADASVGLGGFVVTPVDPALAIPISVAPVIAPAPASDSTGDSVGATVAQFRVDESGNATYSVPIQVPPGTAGMAPKMALAYNSRAANGVMGPGWGIQGTSQITRCRQARENGDFMNGTTPIDGNPAPVNFTQSDRFCLDGVRLLVTTGTYGANNSVYSPENDPTTQVSASVTTLAAGPDTFTVKRKDGSTSTYGNTTASPNARITATLPATGSTVAVSWNLARAQDSVGNYIDYLYAVSPSGSTFPFSAVEFVLSQVNYTGHATSPVSSPYASITFGYTSLAAPYVRLGYQAGIAFLQTQQLKSITVADTTASNPTLRYYQFSYQTSASGSAFQQVSQIQECRDSTLAVCFPPTMFTWSAATYAFVNDSTQTQSSPDFTNLVGWKVGDVDGDGRLDFVFAKNNDSHCTTGSALYVGFLDRTPTGQMTLATGGQVPTCATIDLSGKDLAWYLMDYDGDGKADLLIGGGAGSNWAARKSKGRPSSGATVFDTTNLLAGLATPITVPAGVTAAGILADLNGDGIPDFIYPVTPSTGSDYSAVEARMMVRQADGSFAFSAPYAVIANYTDNTCIPSAGHVVNCDFNFFENDVLHRSAIVTDINGDGRADLTFSILQQTDTGGTVPNLPTSDPPQPGYNALLGTAGQSSITTPATVTNKFFWYQFLANGTSQPAGYAIPVVNLQQQWSALMHGSGGTLPTSSASMYVVDLNNDGLADILYQDPTDASGQTYQAMLNSGSGYHAPIAITGITSNGASPPLQLVDVNGDGKIDLVYPASGGTYNYVSLVPSTTATGGWAFSTPQAMSAGVHSSSGWIAMLGDFDGDGAPDFLSLTASSSNNLYASRVASGSTCTALSNSAGCSRYHARDVITRFTNGFGAATNVAYQPLTNEGVYQPVVAGSRALNSDNFGYGSPVFDVLAPLYVVTEAHSSAPVQGNASAASNVYYRYQGALMQSGGRGFLGFWGTWSFDANDSANESNQYIVTLNGYDQEYPFIGVPETNFKLAFTGPITRGNATLDTCAISGPEATAGCFGGTPWPDFLNGPQAGVNVGDSTTVPFCNGAGCIAMPSDKATQCTTAASSAPSPNNVITHGTFIPPATPGPILVYSWQSTDSHYELTAPAGLSNRLLTAKSETTSCYDGSPTTLSHGDLVNNRIVTSDATHVVAQKLTTNTYSDITTSPYWYLGRLTQSQVQFLRPSQPTIARTSSFGYDTGTGSTNTGLLVSERIQSGGAADQDLRTVYTLDAYGNRTGAYQCSADLSTDTSCKSTSAFVQQEPNGTKVHRYAKTAYDSIGRYATGSAIPFYSVTGSGHLNEQTALNITARDEFGNAVGQSSINGLTQSAQFGVMGRPYFTADGTGRSSTTTYRLCGSGVNRVGCSSDPMFVFSSHTVSAGASMTWTYFDVLGRPVLTIAQAFDGNAAGQNFTAVCAYHDSHDRPIYQSEPFFLNVAVAADGVSPNLPVSAPSPCASAVYSTTSKVDVLGRVTKILNPDGGAVTKTYTGLETDTMNPRNFVWVEKKNALGEVIETQDPTVTGNASVGVFVDTTYDAAGDVLTVTRDALNNGVSASTTKITTQFSYDALGRKATQTDPDAGTTHFSYNAAGDVVSQTDAKNQTVTQSFDAMGRRWQRVASGADGNTLTDTWTYDTAANGYGQLASETRSATTGTAFNRSFNYDTYGRAGGRTTTIGTTAYSEVTAYDGYSRPMSQQDVTGYSLTTNYSTNGYVDGLTDSRVNTLYTVNTMTARNQVATEQRGSTAALATSLSYYTDSGRVHTLCSGIQSGTGRCNLQDLNYAFDLAGNLTSRARASSTAPTLETFVNDAVNRLTTAQLTSVQGIAQVPPITTAALTYDLVGNVCSKNTYAYTYAGLAGCTNHGTSGSPHAVKNVATASGTITYGYDTNGNQTGSTGAQARTLTYNALNQLTSASAGSSSTAFQYGPDGDRFLRTDGSPVVWPAGCRTASDRVFCNGFDADQTGGAQTTTYVGNVEIVQSGTTTERRRYLGGVAIDYVRSSGSSTSYLFADHLGSVDAVASSAGALIEAMSFDVHGNRRDPVSWQGVGAAPVSTAHGFTGHEHVDTFGFIHMNGRVYDPTIGRMLQADPLTGPGAQSLNSYSYVINNPLALTDPTGYSWWRDVLAIAIIVFAPEAFPELFAEYGFAATVATGFVAGVVQSDHLSGGLYGAFSAGLFYGIGQGFDNADWAHQGGTIGSTNLNAIGYTAKVLAHGVAGGVMQSLEGGKFGNGFLSAGFAEAASPGIDRIDPENPVGQSVSAERVVAASIVGGTANVLGGGKFANGAVTGAFSRAFNEESLRQSTNDGGTSAWSPSYAQSGSETHPPSLYPDAVMNADADAAAMQGLNPSSARYTDQGEWDGSIISSQFGVYPSLPTLQTITVTANALQTSFTLSPGAIAIYHSHIRTGNRGADRTQVQFGPGDHLPLMRNNPLPNYWRDPFGAVRVMERYQGELTTRYVGQEPRN
jgi:RHS repeat-associated protein